MPDVLLLAAKARPTQGVDFEYLFENLPDPAIFIGPDKKVAASNRTFRERFPGVIESRLLDNLQTESSRAERREDCFLSHVEPKRQSFAGGKIWPALQPKVVELPSGGTLVVFKPTTSAELDYLREINCLKEQLRCRRAEVRAAVDAVNNCKKNFANVGHELRTPLNAIVGFSDMLRQQMLGSHADPRYQRYAEIIHDSGLRLLDVINDILDFAKVDAGKLELRSEEVHVLSVVIDSVRELELLAAKSGIGISIHVCDSVSLIIADRKRLRQILNNLLSNSLKFTPAGGTISIDIYRRRQSIAISVCDTGVGMMEADIPVALEPFGQLRGTALSDRGTGLGLPLANELAKLHGGVMEIESIAGFGTTVTILLPESGIHQPFAKAFEKETVEGSRVSGAN
jgi:signal transduction histidine kinase